MRWYAGGVPAALVLFMPPAAFVGTDEDALALWSLVCGLGALFNIGAAYAACAAVLGLLVAPLRPVALVVWIQIAHTLLGVAVPLLGRVGSRVPLDAAVGALVGILAGLIRTLTPPWPRPPNKRVCFSVLAALLVAACATPAFTAARPKRLALQHVSRPGDLSRQRPLDSPGRVAVARTRAGAGSRDAGRVRQGEAGVLPRAISGFFPSPILCGATCGSTHLRQTWPATSRRAGAGAKRRRRGRERRGPVAHARRATRGRSIWSFAGVKRARRRGVGRKGSTSRSSLVVGEDARSASPSESTGRLRSLAAHRPAATTEALRTCGATCLLGPSGRNGGTCIGLVLRVACNVVFVVNNFLPRGMAAHAASASTRSAALTPERRWAASTVSLPRVAVGATV